MFLFGFCCCCFSEPLWKKELENNQQKFKYIFRCSQFLLLFVNYHLNSRNTPFDVPLNVKLVFLKPGQCISRKPLHHYFKDQPSFHLVATARLVPPATQHASSSAAQRDPFQASATKPAPTQPRFRAPRKAICPGTSEETPPKLISNSSFSGCTREGILPELFHWSEFAFLV